MSDVLRTQMSSDSGISRSGDRPRLPTAKWGAACSACATAKAKCIRSNPDPSSKCDRCQRLFKECAAQVHRPRKKRQVKPSRTAQIEERLNGLVDLLRSSNDLHKSDVDPERLGHLLGAQVSLTDRRSISPSPGFGANPGHVPSTYNSGAPSSCMCRFEGQIPPPPDSDEALLNIYRNELLPAFPFVVIPPTMSAATLKETRPFLMSAIRMVASFRSLRSMKGQMFHLMKEISERVLIRSERSLDTLLGIIIIMGWYQYHCFMHAQLTNLISLAKTLVGELGLQMPPNRVDRSILSVLKPFDIPPRSNEERRALAGVWFLSSSIALGFGKIEAMKYTRYLHRCLKDLEASVEYETDTTLVHFVRVQYLIDRIGQCNNESSNVIDDMPVAPYIAAPRNVYVASLQAELEQIRNNLPPRLQVDKIFQTYLNTAALRLYAPPVIDSELVSSLSSAIAASSVQGSGSPLDEIYRSHTTLAVWFDNWLSVPVSSYYCQPTATCSLIVYAISMLGRWAKLITPSSVQSRNSQTGSTDGTKYGLTPPSVEYPSTEYPGVEYPSVPSSVVSGSTPAAASATDSDPDREACSYGQFNPQTKADPTLPQAVAALQTSLQRQPGLDMDILSILSTIQSRFQQVSASIQGSSANDAEKSDPNVWSMSAIKLLFTRTKLERWADLVAAGTEALSLEDKAAHEAIMGDIGQNPLQDGFLDGLGNIGGAGMGMPDLSDGMGGTGWMMDMMPNMEPTFFDWYTSDWNNGMMNGQC